jgi:hypothetical protein
MFLGWENYFFMLGSAAAGLVGLLFVVVTLTAGFERSQALRGQAIYMTPTMVHFAVVFSICAVAVMPKLPAPAIAAFAALALGLGLVNAARACHGIANPRSDLPASHWSDFWMYGATPALLYLAGLALCALVWIGVAWAPEGLAGLLLVLALVGIRNAWDLVTSIAPLVGPNAAQALAASAAASEVAEPS